MDVSDGCCTSDYDDNRVGATMNQKINTSGHVVRLLTLIGEESTVRMSNGSYSGGGQELQTKVMLYAVLVLYLTTFAFGTLGNTVTIYALVRTKHLKNVANCFILNLAIADDLFLLTLPFMAHSSYIHRWIFGDVLCKVMNVFRGVNLYASIFTITLMSIDRYLAVVHPFDSLMYRTRRSALVICVVIWGVCLAIMTPFWLYARTYRTSHGTMICRINWPQESLNEHLWMWANFELIVGFVLPIGVMAVCYVRLLQRLVAEPRSPINRQGKTYVWRVTTMIFIVTVVFLVCWAPHHVLKLIAAYKNRTVVNRAQPGSNTLGFIVANVVAQGLTFISSCCNPFIYYITSTNFRQIYRTVLCRCSAKEIMGSHGIVTRSSGVFLNQRLSYRKSGSQNRKFSYAM